MMSGGGMPEQNWNLRGLTMEEALAQQKALGQAQMQQAMNQQQAWENHQRMYLEQQAIRQQEAIREQQSYAQMDVTKMQSSYSHGWTDPTLHVFARPSFDRVPKGEGVVITPRRRRLKSYHAVFALTIFAVVMLLIWRTI